ncbi:hypothetical protein A3D70_01645 [Candidatus Adlerbacteria bacterium RIFCSPHIGHO2_02_FULL_54_18]|uniref:DUF5667 domain-containing protein n=2 Tax=Parcubacteria group TaxID=1794811 RepID=A0A1F4Y525_9BACT|nr:MAG: hypothetical protein A3D70_01645 [Candidatus Adlerbacteria bacterium RIFCSPHIGHO2_02_FULL_54_18]OGG77222.1 MAG: hypothetical protein A3B35_03545 [Candidatus Kaiserbacteria bacterium RIFCSPLOWO2_01_FULL_54_24]
MPLIILALLVAAAVGGGASVAAQNALPGEPLWVFKVQVNERVGATLAPGDKAKAGWDIALVRERMEEAEILAAEGALSTSAQAASKANINTHIQGLSRRVAALQERGDYAAAADIAIQLQAAISSHISGPLELAAELDMANALSASIVAQ